MTTPRSKLVDDSTPLFYHLVSRCVRRSWLCGKDPVTGINYDHRKDWLEERMQHLATCFAVEIGAWSIMSNHFHLVLYYDPIACRTWSDEEVAQRWVDAFPPKSKGADLEAQKALRREALLADPSLLADRRRTLGSLSMFMKNLKQPIALRANREDGCQGHFFESRFFSGALLTEQSVLASMAYVDLNPIRAKIAESLEECRHTSIEVRLKQLENTAERLQELIGPLVSGLGAKTRRLQITLASYIDALKSIIQAELDPSGLHGRGKALRWHAQVSSIRKRQPAYGSETALKEWVENRGLKRLGTVLP